jgi:L-lactate dehydrogenase complex protein LldG
MSARENILARLRGSLGRNPGTAASGRIMIDEYLVARAKGPQPKPCIDLLARFREESTSLSSTVDEVASLRDVPQAIARYLSDQRLPGKAVCWPEFAGLDWRAAQLNVISRAVGDDDLIGITGCFCAIAETGTLMLRSGPATPAAMSLLPETHIAIVPAGRIVAVMEDGWQLVRAGSGLAPEEWPRAINFISGPSRTGDIEQTMVLGAHGPYRVHIVIVRQQ